MSDYHINIFYSSEDGGYIAEIPDLPGCSAFGRTPQAAVEEVLVARHAWVDAAHAAGLPVPEPRYRPAPAG
ncbi:MAG: type II toxin-antitoxin system HicB family antitoxin [Actinobacteria bacterium]|nr:type II toxin-antitoxin system HicB family antitoxin [Actinomycetota bacterium]